MLPPLSLSPPSFPQSPQIPSPSTTTTTTFTQPSPPLPPPPPSHNLCRLPYPSFAPKIKLQPHLSLPKCLCPDSQTPPTPHPLAAPTTFSLTHAPPSLAVEIEKAALFDFSFTLPIIALQFLFLRFALDKLYYSLLGKFMDERDAAIRKKVSSVKDTSAEIKEARAEISAALNKMKKETQVEVEEKLRGRWAFRYGGDDESVGERSLW